jgi:hypothetical protein
MALIGFHRLRGGHSGKSMAMAVMGLLDRAGVTMKVSIFRCRWNHGVSLISFKAGHFTMDNASANLTMMKEMEVMFIERDIDFDAIDRHIMCYGHVVNLSSGRVIERATSVAASDAADLDEDWSGLPPPVSPKEQSYEDAVARDPIALGRNVVRVIRASGIRRDAFDEVINDGNRRGWFKARDGQPVKVQPLQLLRDVRTRWDSVFYMLNRLREMRPVRFSPCINPFVINELM